MAQLGVEGAHDLDGFAQLVLVGLGGLGLFGGQDEAAGLGLHHVPIGA